jgi:hypothetical protein
MSAQNPASKSDLIKVERELESLEHSINLLDNSIDNAVIEVNIEAQSQIDLLQKELVYYRVKDDYYSDALSEQSNRFIFYTSILFGIFFVLTWTGFRSQVKSLKKNTKKQIADQFSELEIVSNRIDKIGSGIYGISGNLNTTMGEKYYSERKLELAFYKYMIAGVEHCNADKYYYEKNSKQPDLDSIYYSGINNLSLAMEICSDLKEREINKRFWKQYSPALIYHLNQLDDIKDENVTNAVAELRVAINNFSK